MENQETDLFMATLLRIAKLEDEVAELKLNKETLSESVLNAIRTEMKQKGNRI